MSAGTAQFVSLLNNKLKIRLFLFFKLPSAYFAGVRIIRANEHRCEVSVPYKWFSQNPFKSTYFACLSMAGELSTGALAMAHLYKRKPAVAMLVVKVESEYFKKAIGKTIFVCEDGDVFRMAIERAIETREAQTVRAKTVGRNAAGEIVSELFITWSFKARS
ncbi:MAG: DUF4442 domain-containing protein [Gemmatimonadaceae bacterium]|nr:DUF4442 domain-containing protein [Chitinophagaceae bacterium]